ncbi:MAG: cupin domain-containing protein [Senegalia sp. (in: firmicutes)]|uniref:cupin domain-containing protein n=1 Tax=Senegalia sp. (in: firmicutes) TaxID=1924098 RepID=UPI003F94F116
MSINEKNVEEIVKKVIMKYFDETKNNLKEVDESGVAVVKTNKVKLEKFDTGKPGDKVYLKDVFTLEESPRLGCGVMEMEETVFDWTLKYDEIDYIMEGTLEIIIDGRKIVGEQGDIILIPKDTPIKFSCPDHAKFIYIVYPANWEEL